MAEKKQTRRDERRQMFMGIYYEFILPSGKPKIVDLISFEDLEWDKSGSRRRRRTEVNQGMLLSKLREETLQKLSLNFERSNVVTLTKMIEKYISSKKLTVGNSSINQYKACLKHFVDAIGDFDLESPPEELDEKFLQYLQRRDMSNESINSNVRQVQSFFIWCDNKKVTKERIQLKGTDVTDKVPDTFSDAQMDSLLGLIEEHLAEAGENEYKRISAINQRRALFMLRYSGARAGEIISLPLDRISVFNADMLDVDGLQQFLIADVPEIGFRVKGKHEAFVPIANTQLIDFLIEDLATRNPNEKWYLDNGQGDRQWNSVQTFGRPFDANLRKLGIKGKRTHGFRATVISTLLNKGVPAVAVKTYVRHKHLSTTLGYWSPDTSELRKHLQNQLK